MKKLALLLLATVYLPLSSIAQNKTIEMSAENLRDKIRGSLLGQILENLNGIPHEMDYIHEPGAVEGYIPELLEGARTDDDTDFEYRPSILSDIGKEDPKVQARAAYMAICLGLDKIVTKDSPKDWKRALECLQNTEQIVQVLFHHSPVPAAKPLPEKALAAGIKKPEEKMPFVGMIGMIQKFFIDPKNSTQTL